MLAAVSAAESDAIERQGATKNYYVVGQDTLERAEERDPVTAAG